MGSKNLGIIILVVVVLFVIYFVGFDQPQGGFTANQYAIDHDGGDQPYFASKLTIHSIPNCSFDSIVAVHRDRCRNEYPNDDVLFEMVGVTCDLVTSKSPYVATYLCNNLCYRDFETSGTCQTPLGAYGSASCVCDVRV